MEVCRDEVVWKDVCRVRADQERSEEKTRLRIEHEERRERVREARELHQMARRIQQRLRKRKQEGTRQL